MIMGGWQLSEGHHRDAPDRTKVLDDLEKLVQASAPESVAFDCADIYTGVEELLGALLRRVTAGQGPDSGTVRIHTKLVPDRTHLNRVDYAYVAGIVERSLSRLGTERLDLVQYAWWDYDVPGYVECGQHLDELKRQGKIAAIGVTNFDTPRLREIVEAGVDVTANQLQYSALDHRPESDMVELCIDKGIALLCYGTLAGGLLTDSWLGRDDPTPDPYSQATRLDTRSLTKYRLIVEEFGGWAAYQRLLESLSDIGRSLDATIAQVATAYALALPGVRSVISGVTRPDRFAATLAATKLTLSQDHMAQIRAHADAAPGPLGPVFGLEREVGGAHAAIMKYNLNSGSESLG